MPFRYLGEALSIVDSLAVKLRCTYAEDSVADDSNAAPRSGNNIFGFMVISGYVP